jgi:PAS domain S-box-containing protein
MAIVPCPDLSRPFVCILLDSFFVILLSQDDNVRDTLAYCLTFANDPHDFDRNMIQLDQLMAGQLSYCRNKRNQRRQEEEEKIHQQEHIDTLPLPQQWDEAIRYQTSRAIVITETIRPFRIVHVNTAWENLCGYNKKEAYGQSLGSLLHGPETDIATITSMLFPLLHANPMESGAVVTNYTKNGRRFRNRVRIGPLFDSSNDHDNNVDSKSIGNCFARPTTTKNVPTTHHHPMIHQQQQPSYFVGVLQEIHDGL